MLGENDGSFLEVRHQSDYMYGVLRILASKPSAFEDVRTNIIWRVIQGIFPVEVRPRTEKNEAILLFRGIWRKIFLEMVRSQIASLVRGPKVKNGTRWTYPSQLSCVALEKGNTRFLVELLDAFPDVIYHIDEDGLNIFHAAASYRNESIYGIMYETGPVMNVFSSMKDISNNNMLHLIGKNPRGNLLEDVPGAAFQMQRELLWSKEVEVVVPGECLLEENSDGFTPDKVFEDNHKQMVEAGREWMKLTVTQCIVVAGLVATVAYSTNFTFPGGYNDNGYPIFRRSNSFLTFSVLNGIAFVLAIASALIFLSILWTRYNQQDFLETLPKRLMVAVSSFFFSITSLIVAFAISFFLLYRKRTLSLPIIVAVVSVVAAIPVLLYIKMESADLLPMVRSLCSSRYLFRPKKRVLYR